jgi:hypothetical protein
MGVLDDAIREHLDLKRRHGAGEDELRRQEEEALGPARREVAPADSDDGDGTGAQTPDEVETAHAGEPELSEAIPDEAVHSDVQAAEETELHELPAEAEGHQEPHAEPELLHEEPPAAEQLAPAPAQPTTDEEAALDDEHRQLGDTPARGFEPVDDDQRHEDELDDEHFEEEDDDDGSVAEGEDADVLEDTPDFLQETPEHDRLWFEQKPPRDFDFD